MAKVPNAKVPVVKAPVKMGTALRPASDPAYKGVTAGGGSSNKAVVGPRGKIMQDAAWNIRQSGLKKGYGK